MLKILIIFFGITLSIISNAQINKCLCGDCNNGFGIFYFTEGDIYSGEWKSGKMEGYGVYKWNDGSKYSGTWKNGKLDGQGIHFSNDGKRKAGTWVDGEFHSKSFSSGCIYGDCVNGYGIYLWDKDSKAYGDEYIGHWKNGYFDGQGKYFSSDGSYYEGEWFDQKNVNGIYFSTNCTKVEGKSIMDKIVLSSNNNSHVIDEKEECLSGDCSNGYGTYHFSDGEKYEGNWQHDKRNGYGANYYKNGDSYIGNWSDDNKQGNGTMTFSNGYRYSGNFNSDKEDGYGTLIFANGDKYIGNFSENKFNGNGTMYYSDGGIKSGLWKNDIFLGEIIYNYNPDSKGCASGNCNSGFGLYIFDSGEIYLGYWQNNQRNGQGTNLYSSKAKFIGNFDNDIKSGFGVYKFEPESQYESYTGYFENDLMSGRGTLLFKNGQKYTGSFKNNVFDGEGTMNLVDGTVQSGIWKEGLFTSQSNNYFGCISGNCKDGTGTYIFQSGDKYDGDWKNGSYVKGTYFYSSGDKYTGEFKDNKKDGFGTFTFVTENKSYTGQWVNDLFDGEGTMMLSDGTRKTGTWKTGIFAGAKTDSGKAPIITWVNPGNFNSATGNQIISIKACIKSNSNISSIKMYVNNIEQLNDTRSYNIINSSDCNYTLERNINLNHGDNAVLIVASNNSGSTTSEIRTIKCNSSPVTQQNKTALVIGNSNYIATSPLRNPVNDAKAIAGQLQILGFQVTLLTDISYEDMINAIRNFGEKLTAGKGVGLFYYAGHGIQMGGENYLIPVTAKIKKEQDVEFEAVNLKRVMGEMDFAENGLNIVILDACRDNPFARSFRSSSTGGLATTTAPKGTYIAYATAPGSVASDGTGDNGLYTQELLHALQEKGKLIEDVFKTVRTSVYEKSNQQQVPWDNSALFSDFIFNP